MNRCICIAHRGASGHEPENTLPAFKKAVDLKADWIELDVYRVENELVVIHDATLNRTTNGSGSVMKKSLAYLRSLDAGHGHPIPTLTEVLDLVNRRVGVNIELKGPDTASPVAALIEEYVRYRSWCYDQFLVSSFDQKTLIDVKTINPDIQTGAIFGRRTPPNCAFASSLNIASLHLKRDAFSKALLTDAQRRGLAVFVYTVNQQDDILRMIAMGVNGVFTDFPERVVKLADRLEDKTLIRRTACHFESSAGRPAYFV